MKNQFKPGDLIGSCTFSAGHRRPIAKPGDLRGIILDIDRIVRKDPAILGRGGRYGTSDRYWRITLLITLNRNDNEYFQRDYPVNAVKTLTITDLSKWRKINV